MNDRNVDSRNIEFKTYFGFMKNLQHYDYIFCDEVQDLPEYVVSALKKRCRALIIAGDPNQSIYENTINPNRIAEVSNCKEYSLRIIHRLTTSVINLVNRITPEMDIFNSLIDSNQEDHTPKIGQFNNQEEEVCYVMDQAITVIDARADKSAAILLPTHSDVIKFAEIHCQRNKLTGWSRVDNQYGKPDYNSFNNHMNSMRLHYVGNSYGSLIGHKNVLIMTYHSAKGLDFDYVYLPFLNQEADIRSKTIFMVAITRCKLALTMSYTNNLHPYVVCMEDLCHRINTANNDFNDDSGLDFDF